MAFGNATFTDAGAAVADLFAASADRSKAQGARIEGQEYGLAAGLARQNVEFTQESTGIQEAQASRKIAMSLGTTTAEIGAAGLRTGTGSALDILRSATEQGALTKAVTQQQGLITAAGYEEQAASYDLMQQAAGVAAAADEKAAKGAEIGAAISAAAAVGTLFV